jgi:hypothetical protein
MMHPRWSWMPPPATIDGVDGGMQLAAGRIVVAYRELWRSLSRRNVPSHETRCHNICGREFVEGEASTKYFFVEGRKMV